MNAILYFIPLLGALLLWIGVRVIQGKDWRLWQRRDANAVREWENARKRGFWLHAFVAAFPVVAGIYVLGPLTRSWLETGALSYPMEKAGANAVFAILTILLVGWFSWVLLRAGAREAAERLATSSRDGKEIGSGPVARS